MVTETKNAEVVLDFNKSTKNTFRFDATDGESLVKNIYVSRAAFDGDVQPSRVSHCCHPRIRRLKGYCAGRRVIMCLPVFFC